MESRHWSQLLESARGPAASESACSVPPEVAGSRRCSDYSTAHCSGCSTRGSLPPHVQGPPKGPREGTCLITGSWSRSLMAAPSLTPAGPLPVQAVLGVVPTTSSCFFFFVFFTQGRCFPLGAPAPAPAPPVRYSQAARHAWPTQLCMQCCLPSARPAACLPGRLLGACWFYNPLAGCTEPGQLNRQPITVRRRRSVRANIINTDCYLID